MASCFTIKVVDYSPMWEVTSDNRTNITQRGSPHTTAQTGVVEQQRDERQPSNQLTNHTDQSLSGSC